MISKADKFRSWFPVMEAAIIASKDCKEFLDYLKGRKPEEMCKDELNCVLTKFLYPLLQTVEDEDIRNKIKEEIETFNTLLRGE